MNNNYDIVLDTLSKRLKELRKEAAVNAAFIKELEEAISLWKWYKSDSI